MVVLSLFIFVLSLSIVTHCGRPNHQPEYNNGGGGDNNDWHYINNGGPRYNTPTQYSTLNQQPQGPSPLYQGPPTYVPYYTQPLNSRSGEQNTQYPNNSPNIQSPINVEYRQDIKEGPSTAAVTPITEDSYKPKSSVFVPRISDFVLNRPEEKDALNLIGGSEKKL